MIDDAWPQRKNDAEIKLSADVTDTTRVLAFLLIYYTRSPLIVDAHELDVKEERLVNHSLVLHHKVERPLPAEGRRPRALAAERAGGIADGPGRDNEAADAPNLQAAAERRECQRTLHTNRAAATGCLFALGPRALTSCPHYTKSSAKRTFIPAIASSNAGMTVPFPSSILWRQHNAGTIDKVSFYVPLPLVCGSVQ